MLLVGTRAVSSPSSDPHEIPHWARVEQRTKEGNGGMRISPVYPTPGADRLANMLQARGRRRKNMQHHFKLLGTASSLLKHFQ